MHELALHNVIRQLSMSQEYSLQHTCSLRGQRTEVCIAKKAKAAPGNSRPGTERGSFGGRAAAVIGGVSSCIDRSQQENRTGRLAHGGSRAARPAAGGGGTDQCQARRPVSRGAPAGSIPSNVRRQPPRPYLAIRRRPELQLAVSDAGQGQPRHPFRKRENR